MAKIEKRMIYHWKSEFLSSYSDGDIFVLSSSVDEARKKGLIEMVKYFQLNEKCDNDPNEYSQSLDEYNKFEYEKLKDDFAKEPEVKDVFWVRGSD